MFCVSEPNNNKKIVIAPSRKPTKNILSRNKSVVFQICELN